MNDTIIPIVAVYSHTDKTNNTFSPAAELLNQDRDVVFSPIFVAAACVAVYECFERHVAESQQNDFEMCFQELFAILFKSRAEFMNFIPKDNFDEGEY